MSEAAITVILTHVTTILEQQIRQEVRLISGVEKQIRKLQSEFESLKAVLIDAEKRQIREETVKIWLEKLKDISYDADDVLSEWITLMHKAESEENLQNQISSPTRQVFSLITLPCLGLNKVTLRRDIAIKIRNINDRLTEIANERYKYSFNLSNGDERVHTSHKTTSFVDVSEVEGRDLDKNTLMRKLLSDKKRAINVISVVGLGGIGKTTLAQVVYNTASIIRHFDKRIWVCVSEPFEEVRVAKAIVEDIEDKAPELFELETLARRIRDLVGGTKFLLVLDDVWNDDIRKWDPILSSLKTGAAGSAILVTTRSNRVGAVMGCNYELRLGKLSDHDSWNLFKKIAFFERKTEEFEVLENVGKQISDKCKGLPLTIKTIASLLRFKNSCNDWQDVLNSEFWEFKKEVEGLFPPLMLSYYDLSSIEKRCFSYCAVFPKDHVIEAKSLIQLWMAQGYLSSVENVEMEVLGQEYLQNLAMRSFFQDLVKDKSGNKILSFKMHDMVHDFAQYLTKNECSVVEFNNDVKRKMESSNTKPRHLTVVRSDDITFPDIPNVDKLFTLWVQSFYDSPPIIGKIDEIEPELFRRLKCVRSLDLSRNRLGELPKEVGNLIKLKYLNLCHNPLGELPSTLSELYSLQTLKLSACNHLTKLPPGIGNLANLRHLEIDKTDSLKTLPKGIGKLKSLKTLNKFIVSKNRGGEACVLEDLSNLNNLRGCLEIEGLGNVADVEEAKRAQMKKKIHLTDVQMDFGNSGTQTRSSNQDEVIEGLELHENVQSLVISSFSGTKLPNWMMRLINLQKLFIQDCQNCANLPPLGKLPSLVTLHIEGMNGIKCIGLDFLGTSTINGQDRSESSSMSSSAFPKLKKLKISKMERWEEWEVRRQDRDMEIIMPRLRCLKISRCSKLKFLPSLRLQTAPLGKLRVDECPLLKQRYNKGSGEDWSKISHISKVRIS